MSRILDHPDGKVSIEQLNDQEFIVYNHLYRSSYKRNIHDQEIWVNGDRRISGAQLLYECKNSEPIDKQYDDYKRYVKKPKRTVYYDDNSSSDSSSSSYDDYKRYVKKPKRTVYYDDSSSSDSSSSSYDDSSSYSDSSSY